ncbi:MAG: 4Fe-4S dicluster domain-containing protein, partial [Actinobacteria bacterium]|nr:4Fe-4S dicluster domain-containing protein [Actinomycetota bacterium]
KGILYDASKCVGCHYCEGSCKNTYGLPGEVTYDITALPEKVLPELMVPVEMLKVLEAVQPVTEDDRDALRWLRVTSANIDVGGGNKQDIFVRHSCTHCGLCAQVCPSKALTQREDGIVVVDSSRCIGCFYCYQACPFDIPRYLDEVSSKAMQKCAMCFERVTSGEEPACVKGCPVGALTFGDSEDIVAVGQQVVAGLVSAGYKDAYLYGEKELGGIGVISALPFSYETYDLPKLV